MKKVLSILVLALVAVQFAFASKIRSCVKILADCGSVSIIKNSSFWMYAFSQIIIRMIII